MSDPSWNNGFYYERDYPVRGIRLARSVNELRLISKFFNIKKYFFNFSYYREIATLSYRSGPEWNTRFGRSKINENEQITLCPTFQIENYLNHQGEVFADKYDPNSLIYLSKVILN